ncbi:MAG: hypothetical protein F4X97_13280 [Boseongicola sp. SB0662_bin_57]|nr:hypothetical protein [Boseongicola sp. SB0662_bin_57]
MKKTLTTATVAAFLAATGPAPAEPTVSETIQWLADILRVAPTVYDSRSRSDGKRGYESEILLNVDFYSNLFIVEKRRTYRSNRGDFDYKSKSEERISFTEIFYPTEIKKFSSRSKETVYIITFECHSGRYCVKYKERRIGNHKLIGLRDMPVAIIGITDEEMAGRIKNAFDHLIRLSGGAKRVKEDLF